MRTNRTVLIAAAGTGGHIFPALAVGQALAARGWSVAWIGNASGMEAQRVAATGWPFHDLAFGQVRGKGWRRWVSLPWSLAKAVLRARRLIEQGQPAVVAVFGGYVAVPVALAARSLGLPVVLHEQNARPGLANRVLAPLVSAVLAGFPEALPGAQWLGNPVRAEFTALAAPAERYRARSGPLRLLVVGGSLGAQALNALMPQALALLPHEQRPEVWHQCGARHEAATRSAYAQAGVEASVEPFIEEMVKAYAWADVLVCRAGAMTVAEVTAAGVAAHFVPYPHAVDDHQYANAAWLARDEAAWVTRQEHLTPAAMAAWLGALTREECLRRAELAWARAKRDATERIAAVIEEYQREE